MGRALTHSENHRETSASITGAKKKFSLAQKALGCVCDNANRDLIEKIFGNAVGIKYDPVHIIQRFTEEKKR
ncbi:hypothetical protein JG688_00008081 [Phytophthora aleatoria]|uniref:Uncharacterized protein n=1 Tax=Phytophthora aleatoria TaxID=2496075 RepID=A0A8J5M7M6_9STRA|nr:hypothetical protein JG688_00008081 [Phytophthora aleatoria]